MMLRSLAEVSCETYKDMRSLNKLEAELFRKGAFNFPTTCVRVLNKKVHLIRAANTNMWPMGTHFWTRDNCLIADRLSSCETFDLALTKKNRRLGIRLLLSNLSLASTPSQRTRMKRVIVSDNDQFVCDAANWPQIFLSVRNNLDGRMPEKWAHKQDAWQMLAYIVLDKLEKGEVTLSEIDSAQREFLSLIFPFLLRTQYFKQQNSGSWEELEAVRSSVVAWEVALLSKIARLLQWQKFDFLGYGFEKYQRSISDRRASQDLETSLKYLITQGAQHLKEAIPFECPFYTQEDPRFRTADSALIYLLQLEIPRLVANILDLPDAWIDKSETALLRLIMSLYDARSGGFRRYDGDSYQRLGFFRDDISARLSEMYGAPSGDVSQHFVARDSIVPKGPEAAWTHFTWQLSAWAGNRFQITLNSKYLTLQKHLFAQGLRTITKKGMTSVEQTSRVKMRKIPIPAYRFPECYLTEVDKQGEHYLFPTPHTPLNWATAEALSAFTAMRRTLLLSK